MPHQNICHVSVFLADDVVRVRKDNIECDVTAPTRADIDLTV